MPRKGKGSKQPRSATGRDQAVARFWQGRIHAGIEARKDYLDRAKSTLDSLRSRHSLSFSGELKTQFVDFSQGGSMLSIPKPAQVQASLAPLLNMDAPHRRVVSTSSDGVMVGMARVLEAYLNYTAKEAELGGETRRALNDGIVRGRGYAHTMWDDVLEVVTSKYRSSRDVVIDPDVDHVDDAMWMAWRSLEPRWLVQRRVKERGKKDAWRVKGLQANFGLDTPNTPDEWDSGGSRAPATSSLVEVWHVYSKMGWGARGLDFAGDREWIRYDDSMDFVALEIALNHDVPLYEGDWDIPLYLDRAWPLEKLDLVDSIDTLHPESIHSLAGPLQVAIDQTASIIMTGVKNRGRTIILGDESLSTEMQERMKIGGMAEYFPVENDPAVGGFRSLRERFHVLDLGAMHPANMAWLDWLSAEYETTTGVTPILSGADMAGAQERSATASQQRGQAANARVNDWRKKVTKWGARLARNEAIYVRLGLEAEDVAPYVETNEIGMFYPRVEVPDGGVLKLRSFRGDLSVMRILPEAAQFFPGPQEAAMALAALWEEMQTTADYEVTLLVSQLGRGEQGMPPSNLSVAPVTVEDVWRETSGITATEVMREFGYEIGVGSMEVLDKEKEKDMIGNLLQTVMPPALQTGSFDIVNHLLNAYYEVHEVPDERRAPPFQPPAPPSGPPAPQGAPA